VLQPGNTKLGEGIWTFSIPVHTTCPGETKACAAACYAAKGRYYLPAIQSFLETNRLKTESDDFVEDMLAELRINRVKTLRIHVAGDFYSTKYIKKWQTIIPRSRNVTFLVYTRSWRIKEMKPALLKLAKLPNLHMWWSADKDTVAKGEPPLEIGRVAYMCSAKDEPVPSYADLVFRVYRNSVEKYKDGVLVCPAEQGVKSTRGPKMTCSACGVCFNEAAVPSRLVMIT
jgi:hypothetical protein